MTAWIWHTPQGLDDECTRCGRPADRHRVEHVYAGEGETCGACRLPRRNHKVRSEAVRKRRNARPRSEEYRKRKNRKKDLKRKTYYIGLDGEGQGRFPHRYVVMCAADGEGKRHWETPFKSKGLSTKRCLDFLLSLPRTAKVFSYGFNYDLTMILKDLPPRGIYRLWHAETRARPPDSKAHGPFPIFWKGYWLNMLATRFTVKKGKKTRVVWDIMKFFQSKFTDALIAWKVEAKEKLLAMQAMKEKRAQFDKLSPGSIVAYCKEECMYMARLAQALVKAHEDAGLRLRSFYGAGSCASAIFDQLQVPELQKPKNTEAAKKHRRWLLKRRNGMNKAHRDAVGAAFFGGRFDHAVIGAVKKPVYAYDISSAYPYAITFLPCLLHGKWTRTKSKKRARRAKAACIRYRVTGIRGPWGPFPFRTNDGSIVFPAESAGGWVWQDEYFAGERLFPKHVTFREAWVLESKCGCRPFAPEGVEGPRGFPHYYRERMRIGKEGPGIVFKLGPNSGYGKLAQSVGLDPMYQSWVWAGMITSSCRAQVLDLFGRHKSLGNILGVATDGVFSTEKIDTPTPRYTATDVPDVSDGKNKPLGGWERKTFPEGLFFARPGVYFPINPKEEDLAKVRGRGVGRRTVLASWRQIVRAYRRGQKTISLEPAPRFSGARLSVYRTGQPGSYTYKRSPAYGAWIPWPVEMTFDPLPKRGRIVRGGKGWGRLTLRTMPKGVESAAYDSAVVSPEAKIQKYLAAIEQEQPEGGESWEGEV